MDCLLKALCDEIPSVRTSASQSSPVHCPALLLLQWFVTAGGLRSSIIQIRPQGRKPRQQLRPFLCSSQQQTVYCQTPASVLYMMQRMRAATACCLGGRVTTMRAVQALAAAARGTAAAREWVPAHTHGSTPAARMQQGLRQQQLQHERQRLLPQPQLQLQQANVGSRGQVLAGDLLIVRTRPTAPVAARLGPALHVVLQECAFECGCFECVCGC